MRDSSPSSRCSLKTWILISIILTIFGNTMSKRIKLKCKTGKRVIWYKDDAVLKHNRAEGIRIHTQRWGSLLVLRDADPAVYKCVERKSKSVLLVKDLSEHIKPAFKDPELRKNEEKYIKSYGHKDVKLSCLATSETPITYRWTKFANRASLNSTLLDETKSEFIVKNPQKSDTGFYVCVVKNKYGSISAELYLHVIVGPKPKFRDPAKIEASKYTKSDGVNDVIFSCLAKSRTPLAYRWYKVESGPFSRSHTPLNVKRSELIVKSPRLTDKGLYACVVNNKYGNISAEFYLDVGVQKPSFEDPELRKKKYKYIKSYGVKDVKLSCLATSETPLTYRWTWVDGVYGVNRTSLPGNKSEFIVKNPQVSDSGFYICVVENKHGNISAELYLSVKVPFTTYSPTTRGRGRRQGEKPIFIQKTTYDYRRLWEGDNFKFNCLATSKTQLTYIWYKIVNGDRTLLNKTEYVLELNNVTLSDIGEYNCIAKNEYGDISKEFHVDVIKRSQYRQMIDQDSMKSQTRYAGDNITIDCNLLNNMEDLSDMSYDWVVWNNSLNEALLHQIVRQEIRSDSAVVTASVVPIYSDYYQKSENGSRLTLPGDVTINKDIYMSYITCIVYNESTYDFASMFLHLVDKNESWSFPTYSPTTRPVRQG